MKLTLAISTLALVLSTDAAPYGTPWPAVVSSPYVAVGPYGPISRPPPLIAPGSPPLPSLPPPMPGRPVPGGFPGGPGSQFPGGPGGGFPGGPGGGPGGNGNGSGGNGNGNGTGPGGNGNGNGNGNGAGGNGNGNGTGGNGNGSGQGGNGSDGNSTGGTTGSNPGAGNNNGSTGNSGSGAGSSSNSGSGVCGLTDEQVSALTPLLKKLGLAQTGDEIKELVRNIVFGVGDILESDTITQLLDTVDKLVNSLGLGGLDTKPAVDEVVSVLRNQVPCLLNTLLPLP